jgi:serine/threonine protein kinase
MDTKNSQSTRKHPVFNGEYEILSSLGEGNTSKVYLARSLKDPSKQVALKILREEFLNRDHDSIKSVEQEIQILNGLKHKHIVNILGWGTDGHVHKPSGREIKNLVYILLEFVTGGLLFDVCQTLGGMGEEGGRYFLSQMIDVLGYMQGKGVVHRDLKLENILVNESMDLKVADFGFATYKKIDKLKSYRGTMTYMAPEIKEGKAYDGRQIDVFSTGVILFIIVQGIFPFKEAKKDEYFYNLLLQGRLDHYWKKVGGERLSPEFKDLILSMFSYDPKKRPTVEELKNHPWMKKPMSHKLTRQGLIDRLQEKRSCKTADSSREADASRAVEDPMLEFVRQVSDSQVNVYKFNDMTDHDISVAPAVIWDELRAFNEDYFDGKMQLQ